MASTAVVYAASETTPGYKLVNTYDEDEGIITAEIYVTDGYGAVGQIGLYYDTELLNLGATVDKNLTDDFNPAPTNITVSRDGIMLLGTDYTYVNGTLTVPSASGGIISVPPATFSQDPTTGIITVTPSIVEYTVTGII
jgi:hypothetical protein